MFDEKRDILPKEIILPVQVQLYNGWHDLEFDGEKDFRWSSLSSSLAIDSEKLPKEFFLSFYIGNPEVGKTRFITFKYSGNKKTHNLLSGWNYYLFYIDKSPEGDDNHLFIEVDSPLIMEAETRELGIMVSAIDIFEAKKECMQEGAIKKIMKFDNIRLLIFQGIDTKGVIIFTKDKFIKINAGLIFLDIVYEAQGKINHTIEFKSNGYKVSYLVLYGGLRMFSLRLPCQIIKENSVLKFTTNTYIDFKNIIIREDYYDFLGLKSKFCNSTNIIEQERKTLKASQKINFEIQWFVTWHCNFKCPYCWQETESKFYRQVKSNPDNISAERWAETLNGLNPRTIYLTGGEPFLYKDIIKVIKMLDRKIKLRISSNLSDAMEIESFASTNPDRFKMLAFSLHPLQYDSRVFFERLEFLVKEGFGGSLVVEMVLSPGNLAFAPLALERCKELRIPLILDPCIIEKKTPEYLDNNYQAQVNYFIRKKWNYNISMGLSLERKNSFFGSAFRRLYHFVKMPGWVKNSKKTCLGQDWRFGKIPIFCSAGMRRINLDYKGDAYVCMSAIDRSKKFGDCSLPHYYPIGNIFSKDFKLLKKPIICWESFRCASCDWVDLNGAWNELGCVSKSMNLPLPE